MKERMKDSLELMNERLVEKARDGVLGIRLLVSPRAGITPQDVAGDFCGLDALRSRANVRTSVGF